MTVDEGVRALGGLEKTIHFFIELYDYEGCKERRLVPELRLMSVELGRRREEFAENEPEARLTEEVEAVLEALFSKFEDSTLLEFMSADPWRDPRYAERTEGWRKLALDYRRVLRWSEEGQAAHGRGALVLRDTGLPHPEMTKENLKETHFFEFIEYVPLLEGRRLARELEGLQVEEETLLNALESYDTEMEAIVLVERHSADGGLEIYPYKLDPHPQFVARGMERKRVDPDGDFLEGLRKLKFTPLWPARGYRHRAAGV